MLDRLFSSFRTILHPAQHHPFCVVSHPKSGRTWLRVMLDELEIKADYSHGRKSKRKGYQHYSELTTELPHRYKRILILTRDPRDSSVSCFHQMTKRSHSSHRYEGSMGEFLRDPRVGIEKAAHFNLIWAEFAAGRDDAMVISYEDMRADPVDNLLAIADFLGAHPSRSAVEEVVERNEFSRMQERERSGEFAKIYGRPLMPRDPSDPSSFKVRRGKVGSYRDELEPEDIAYCEATLEDIAYGDRMQKLTDNQSRTRTGQVEAVS